MGSLYHACDVFMLMRVTFRVEEPQISEDHKSFDNCVRRLNCKQSQARKFYSHTDVNRLIA